MSDASTTTTKPGRLMRSEIAEQPAVFDRILADGIAEIHAVAATIKAANPRFVLLAARGTSDHAALYAKYLIEIVLGLPAGLASPSTMTAYGAKPDMRDVLFVGVSQSGGSPDLVESLATARSCGALTLAVTNNAASNLAAAAQLHINVLAGPEKAVAATKTYTAELLALYLLIDALGGGNGAKAAGIAASAQKALNETDAVTAAAARIVAAERLVVTGRGYSYPTASEAALKLMETSYVSAQSFSGADLLHGPMAMLQQDSAAIAIAPRGVGGSAMQPVLDRLVELDTNLIVVGPALPDSAKLARIPLPEGIDEQLSPLVEIIPLQMLACEVAISRGNDPDAPRGLKKVTETW